MKRTESIGSRIRELRESVGMSQEELAIKIGYKDRSTIAKIELDARNLTQSKIKSIADVLHVTPAYIMGWDQSIQNEDDVCMKLSEEERELIQQYRSMDQSGKDFIKTVIDREQNRKEK